MEFLREIHSSKLTTILCLVILVGLCWIMVQHAHQADFLAYWSAAKIFVEGGNPYDLTELREVQRNAGRTRDTLEFWNPPWAFCLFLPLLRHLECGEFIMNQLIVGVAVAVLGFWSVVRVQM